MNRDAIVRKLNALKAKFEHEGTSETEALAALEKYNELMQKYNMSETDLHIRESGIAFGKFHSNYSKNHTKNMPPMGFMIQPIAMLTETKGVLGIDKSAIFIGTRPDVEYAEFIYRLIDNAFVTSWKAYRYSFEYTKLHRSGMHGKTIRNSFEKGFLERMTGKILELIETNKEVGNALVLVKNELIVSAMEQAGMKTTNRTAIARYKKTDAYQAGGDAADQVRLRKEAAATKTLMLTGRG